MTTLETNKLIHEKVMRLAWHTPADKIVYGSPDMPNYFKWEYYGPMLEVAMTKEWWGEFINRTALSVDSFNCSIWIGLINQVLLNPLRGSTSIAKFLKEKKDV